MDYSFARVRTCFDRFLLNVIGSAGSLIRGAKLFPTDSLRKKYETHKVKKRTARVDTSPTAPRHRVNKSCLVDVSHILPEELDVCQIFTFVSERNLI